MPIRHRPDFKEALSTLRRLKNQEDQAYYQNWWQRSSSSWWNWQDSWWHPSSEYHHDDGLDTDRAGKPATISEWSIYLWNESHNEFGAKVTAAKFGNSQRSSLSPTGGAKRKHPTAENWLRKLYQYSKKNYKSTEDKHETNHINNQYNDTNMNTRKMQLKTSNGVQMCSLIYVAHVVLCVLVLVGVGCVTAVIVHTGHEDVPFVIHFYVAVLFVIFCIRRCSLYNLESLTRGASPKDC